MKLLFNFFILIIFLFFSFLVKAENHNAKYKISLKGVKIGELKWSLIIENGSYETAITLNSKGVFSPLLRFRGEYVSKGSKKNNYFISEFYSHDWNTNKTNKKMEVVFLKTKAEIYQEPVEKEFSRIDFKKIYDHNDPIASFINLILNKPSSKTIDGRRVYIMDQKFENIKDKKRDIVIMEYVNIWADHKRNDLKKITYLKNGDSFFPKTIEIYFKNNIFKLIRI